MDEIDKRGFTLIELMIVVAIIGVIAAIALPAYRDYVKRARMSEVLNAIDAIATGVNEYHSAIGFFPSQSYGSNNLAHFSEEYAAIALNNTGDINYSVAIVANFNPSLDLTLLGGEGELWMQVTYDIENGYSKVWTLSNTTIEAMFIPKK